MRAVATDRLGPARLDRFGAVASNLGAGHCAVCALLPTAFGALGLGLLLSHETECVFTLVAVVFAAGALLLGWRRHPSVLVAGLLAPGIVGLLASRASRSVRRPRALRRTAPHPDGTRSSAHGRCASRVRQTRRSAR